MNDNIKHTVNHFIEQMGMTAQADGLPRISGKILGLLIIESGPFSFSEIAERLEVSRASVSTNTRLLENLSMIDRVSKTGCRGDFFQLSKNPYEKLLQGVSQRMEKSVAIVDETINALPRSEEDSQARLVELETFYSEYLKNTMTLILKLQNRS